VMVAISSGVVTNGSHVDSGIAGSFRCGRGIRGRN
jgi:hypothetical protein